MPSSDRERLSEIKTFPSLVKYLRDELDWPIEADDFDELTFDYEPEELGLDAQTAAKVEEIKQLRPLVTYQPWGIFFVKFEPKRLPVVALRRILSQLVMKKRASARKAEQKLWGLHDLLFISNYGEGDQRQITFAHFAQEEGTGDLPTLRVLGWDDADTALHIDHVHKELKEKLRWPEDGEAVDQWRTRWSSVFTLRHREVITTSKDLSQRLAQLAAEIRKRVNTVLRLESEHGALRKLQIAFKETLIHDLSDDDFADMYAQTITYGLLTARVSRPAGIVAQNVADMVPVTNPFLRDMLSTFLTVGGRKGKIDFDEVGINDVVQTLRNANMEAVLRDFGDRKPEEDPVIFFYEDFLKAYDPEKKIKRGIFYTPRPVVSYIVRSVHELLQKEFSLEDGLAATATWSEMAERNLYIKVPEGVSPDESFVQIIDPAVGTGTFLVEVIDVIHRTMTAKWQKESLNEKQRLAAWNDYVSKHLLPRLHGFELMMAPYAIAHMKIGLKLYETGYRFGSEERARIYLTNSLEPPSDIQPGLEGLSPALAHEARAVNDVKRCKRFTVVIGNPPYAVNSANKNSPIDPYLDIYKNGLDDERNLKPLNDDYVKFLRYSQSLLCHSDVGLLGMITNHSYATARLFRAMRRSICGDFDSMRFLDLRGDANRDPSMSEDQNVFDIQQGVGISLYSRLSLSDRSGHGIFTYELTGPRDTKCAWLTKNSAFTTSWSTVTPKPELYLFKCLSENINAEYQCFLPLNHFFEVGNVGYQTHRDEFIIDFDRQSLAKRIEALRESSGNEDQLSRTFGILSNRDWSVVSAHQRLKQEKNLNSLFQETLYRPFDLRHIFYASYMIDYDRHDLMQHMIPSNIGLLVSKVFDEHEFTSVFVTKWIVESKVADRTRGSYLFPLRLTGRREQLLSNSKEDHQWFTNFRLETVTQLAKCLGVDLELLESEGSKKSITGIDILNWIYAILHAPNYRRRYADFLKTDLPRLPLTANLDLFHGLAVLGGELVALHVMESPKLNKHITKWLSKTPSGEVEKVSYSDETMWIDKAKTEGFRGVPDAVWNFHIGGYQVCEKWLKDRKGRRLSADDINHYHKIVVALNETIRLMAEIDKVIEKHGGWPGAFSTS